MKICPVGADAGKLKEERSMRQLTFALPNFAIASKD